MNGLIEEPGAVNPTAPTTGPTCASSDGQAGPSIGPCAASGDRLPRVAAGDVDPDRLGCSDGLGAEHLGEDGREGLGEEPVGVRPRLPQADDTQTSVGRSDVPGFEAIGVAARLGERGVELLDRVEGRSGDCDPLHDCSPLSYDQLAALE